MAVKIRSNKLAKLIGKVVNDAHQKYQDRQNEVLIKDWAGNTLFKGHKDSMGVTKVLRANQCPKCKHKDSDDCSDCMGSGYNGSFTVEWVEDREDNVYEFIGY